MNHINLKDLFTKISPQQIQNDLRTLPKEISIKINQRCTRENKKILHSKMQNSTTK